MGKNPSANAGNTASIPGSEKISHVTAQLSPDATSTEPELQSPGAAATEPTCLEAGSATRETTMVRSPWTTARE